ncbi:MAG: type II secretion system ATPase GspE [Thiohalorhabdus sp.]|uniref:type II secretion system ATPase GspE n=1 Tax=Thiohalorhabdus sp. TaxID=3094134 RepID=UPI00398058EE
MSLPPPSTITPEEWREALEAQGGDSLAAARQLIERGSLTESSWAMERARQLGWAHEADPDLGRIDADVAGLLGFGQARRLGILPAYRENLDTVIWVRPDVAWETLLELQGELGTEYRPVMIPEEPFNRALQRAFERTGAAADAVEDLGESVDLDAASAGLPESADLLDSQDDAPIIRLLNAVMTQAIEEGASDVHIEPFESRVVIRYRVDGVLRDLVEPPPGLSARIAARVKVMARMNIAERRVPQDGRISLRLAGRTVDVRVSTLPTQYGERVVMRILEKEQGPLTLAQLGMPESIRTRFEDLIRSPYGIFLVTGPTGSGKTTTLYAALQQVRSPEINIITVEDPVEYDLEGVGQIPVNAKTGMTFARGLRAILRQDPDVIMVGEIRDLETAEVSVQASLTGHRVFSTLHTNDAVGSITRMVDMGVEPYLVASSLLGAMAQRLVRKLCPDCRMPQEADEGERGLLGVAPGEPAVINHPVGCEACGNTGYRGRTGIYELMTVNEELRHLIHDSRGEQTLRQAAREGGMTTLREDGIRLVLAGETSLEEVLRVTQA